MVKWKNVFMYDFSYLDIGEAVEVRKRKALRIENAMVCNTHSLAL